MPLGPIPLTQSRVAAAYDPNGQITGATVNGLLTDAGINAVLSDATVGGKIAGLSNGAIGVTLLLNVRDGSNASFGTNYAGSNLAVQGLEWNGVAANPASMSGSATNSSFSGTWYCLSSAAVGSGTYAAGLFRRVA